MNNINLLNWLSKDEYNILLTRCKYYGMCASVAFEFLTITEKTIYIAVHTSRNHSGISLNSFVDKFFKEINLDGRTIVIIYHFSTLGEQLSIEASEQDIKDFFSDLNTKTILQHLDNQIENSFEFQPCFINLIKYELIKRFKEIHDFTNMHSLNDQKINSFITSLFKVR